MTSGSPVRRPRCVSRRAKEGATKPPAPPRGPATRDSSAAGMSISPAATLARSGRTSARSMPRPYSVVTGVLVVFTGLSSAHLQRHRAELPSSTPFRVRCVLPHLNLTTDATQLIAVAGAAAGVLGLLVALLAHLRF